MKKGFLFVMVIFSLPLAAEKIELFQLANGCYNRGSLDSAILLYERALEAEEVSPEVFFNLGNSYYRKKKFPAAILNYERALRLAPGDEDVIANLTLANLFVVDKISPVPEVFYRRWLGKLAMMHPEAKWAWMGLFCWFTIILLAVAFVLSARPGPRKILFFTALFLIPIFSFFIYSGSLALDREKNLKQGVLFEPSVYVKSSPDEKGVELFILHEGTKVEIKDRLEGWFQIKVANGSVGWVRSETLEII